MTTGTLQIDGQKFRVIAEQDYKALRAALLTQEREAKLDARDLKIARDRLKNRKASPFHYRGSKRTWDFESSLRGRA